MQPSEHEHEVRKKSVDAKTGSPAIMDRPPLTRGLRILSLILAAYLGILLVMMIFENKLIYFPPPVDRAAWRIDWAAQGFEEARFRSTDGTALHGLYMDHPHAVAHVMYCHGNGEDAADLAWLVRDYRDQLNTAILVWDYRGYGKSEGTPHESGILADAQAAQVWLAERAGIAAEQIVLVGRSVGGGPAVHLATTVGVRGLVLENTFTNLPDVAAVHFPWAPVRWLIRTRYDSLAKIGNYTGPLLQSHGTADEVIPLEIGRRLYDACPSIQKQFVEFPGGSHNAAPPPEYYVRLREFLDHLPPIDISTGG